MVDMKKLFGLLIISIFVIILSCSCMTDSESASTYQPDASYDFDVTELTFCSLLGNKNKVRITTRNLLVPVVLNWTPISIEEGTTITISGVSDYVIWVDDYKIKTSADFSAVSSISVVSQKDRFKFHKI